MCAHLHIDAHKCTWLKIEKKIFRKKKAAAFFLFGTCHYGIRIPVSVTWRDTFLNVVLALQSNASMGNFLRAIPSVLASNSNGLIELTWVLFMRVLGADDRWVGSKIVKSERVCGTTWGRLTRAGSLALVPPSASDNFLHDTLRMISH